MDVLDPESGDAMDAILSDAANMLGMCICIFVCDLFAYLISV